MARVRDIYETRKRSSSSPVKPRVLHNTFVQQQPRNLEVFIRCTDLTQMDTFSKSDPLCVLFMKSLGQWSEYGRTESIPNNLNPRFAQSIKIEIGGADELCLKFTLYDLANFTSKDLRKHDVIGSVEVNLRTLLADKSPFVGNLRLPGDVKPRGCIYLYVKGAKDSRSQLRLQIKGSKLVKRGVFGGKCNAYFEICRLVTEDAEQEVFHPVFRSQVVARSQNPRWPLAEIPLQKVCDNDTDLEILFQCWHFIQDGNDELIGEARCTVENLLQKDDKTLQLYPQQKNKAKRQKSSGCLKILQCYIERQYNVLDFVSGGCNMRFVCAIDFTLSNGDPKEAYSMHCIASEHNEYLEAFRSLGSVLSYYCTEKSFPVFGFGARLERENVVSHHFPLNGNENSPEIRGFESIIETYLQCIQSLTFSGPTYLAPVLRRILEHHVPSSANSPQSYVTVLLLVDGIVNDLDEFLQEVQKSRDLPLSIVVAGVGPCDFQAMEDICCNKNRDKRWNLHFVAVRSKHSKHIARAKVRDMSAQVCRDFLTYMKTRNIHPNAPQSVKIKPLYESLDLDSAVERQTLAKSLSQIGNTNSCCPSCGSNITRVFPARFPVA